MYFIYQKFEVELEGDVDPWHQPHHGFTLEPQVGAIHLSVLQSSVQCTQCSISPGAYSDPPPPWFNGLRKVQAKFFLPQPTSNNIFIYITLILLNIINFNCYPTVFILDSNLEHVAHA